MSHHEHDHEHDHEHHDHEHSSIEPDGGTDSLGIVDDEQGELGGGHEPAEGHDESTEQVFRGNQPGDEPRDR